MYNDPGKSLENPVVEIKSIDVTLFENVFESSPPWHGAIPISPSCTVHLQADSVYDGSIQINFELPVLAPSRTDRLKQ